MKKQLALIVTILLAIMLQNCQKESRQCPEDWQEARIIGQDFRLCACCGGWFIDLGQDTVRTFGFPEGFEIEDLSDPTEVCIQYQDQTGPCQDFEPLIDVLQIEKR